MGRLIETVGNYAETPYYIEQVGVHVYCLEELCYVLAENAFLLDRKIVDKELAKWVDESCMLPELAKQLYGLVNQSGSPSALAGIILEYAHYKTAEKRREIEELFRQSADMDITAKMKNHADYMVKNGKYLQAITEYDAMLQTLPAMNHELFSEIYHNKGVALCRLFRFELAAVEFLRALEENPMNKKAELAYLSALRMGMPQEDYITFIAEHQMWYEASMEVERQYEESRIAFESSEEKAQTEDLLALKYSGEAQFYYGELSRNLASKKWKYREMIAQL